MRVVDDDGADVRRRRDRRAVVRTPIVMQGLLPRPGADRRGVPRRLVRHRRPGAARRRRLLHLRRAQEGHHPPARREHRRAPSSTRDRPPPGGAWRRRRSPCPPSSARTRSCVGGRAQAGRSGDRRRHRRLVRATISAPPRCRATCCSPTRCRTRRRTASPSSSSRATPTLLARAVDLAEEAMTAVRSACTRPTSPPKSARLSIR